MSSFSLEPVGIDLLTPGDNMFQGPFWAHFKRSWGWKPLAFREPQSGLTLLVLLRRFTGGFTLAYVPHGPDLRLFRAGARAGTGTASEAETEASGSAREFLMEADDRQPVADASAVVNFLSGVATSLESLLPGEVGLLRLDSRIPLASRASIEHLVRARGLLPGAVDVQPPTTLLVGLEGGADAVLAGMKSKWRYNIRLAAKRGVTVRGVTAESFESDFSRWYALYEETAKRDRIAIHSSAYYRDFLEQAGLRSKNGEEPVVELLLAEHEGELLAGIVTARMGGRATYVFGASSGHKRNLMPAYALQWQAMQRALDSGCRYYDMFGLPPAADSSHPMHGLYRFKTGFGGEFVQYPGTVDRARRPLAGRAFRRAERVRNWYYKRIRKR
ncbi:MAG: lipid II:glycine glycyltransferase FemX [Spirochaetota bacterium]